MKDKAVAVYNDVYNWFTTNDGELTILEKLIKIVVIFVVIKLVIRLSYMVIDKFFEKQGRFKYKIEEKKANTLAVILKSVSKYILYFIGGVSVLEVFGIPTSSVLAAAGIGGVAIGFGAQSLVKDVITGFFILFEDQYSIGDYIITGNFDGEVEEMGLRVTKIRSLSGDLHIIPNGNIDTVTNRCRGSMRAWVDVGIAYEEDIDNAIRVLNELSEDISKTDDRILEGPKVLGVSNLGNSDVVLTVIAQTKPMEHWAVERELRKRIKEEFDNHNIEIPYPRRVVINRNDS